MTISESERSQLELAARQAAGRAYCPYSHFPVGAAILTNGGEIFAGCNVENASYGLTICAERSAVFQAVANLPIPLVIRAVVVFTPTAEPTAPCGACRQVINEFGPEAEMISICDRPMAMVCRLTELLPHAFGPRNLEP
jgi:cytidine deaminase